VADATRRSRARSGDGATIFAEVLKDGRRQRPALAGWRAVRQTGAIAQASQTLAVYRKPARRRCGSARQAMIDLASRPRRRPRH